MRHLRTFHVSRPSSSHIPRWLVAGLLYVCGTCAIAGNATPRTRYGSFGIDLSAIDSTARPGADFWAYANGAWAKNARFADNEEVVGIAADFSEDADKRIARIMDPPVVAASADADQRKIAAFYASWMDTPSANRRGASTLRSYLTRISHISDPAALAAAFGTASFASPFDFDVVPSPSDPARNDVHVAGGSLGMARDYYLEKGPVYDEARAAYRAYVERILTATGADQPAAKAREIVALEENLARAQATGEGASAVVPVPALSVQLPGIDWTTLLQARGLMAAREVRLDGNEAVRAVASIVASTPLATWKDYLAFRFVSDHAVFLPAVFASAHSDFYDRVLAGLKAPRDRRMQGVRLINRLMPEAVSRLYMAHYFDDATKRQMQELFEDVRAAYGDLIEHATWMDAATRAAAQTKLASLTACIGGPELRTDFSDLAVEKDDLLGNVVRAETKRMALLANTLSAPPPACARYGFAQGSNDMYVREANQVLLPAGSLRPPFFDASADPAVNYGAIGVTIGHEIGHGFDVDGARYDAQGRIANGWSSYSNQAFARNTARVAAQYAAIEVLPGMHIDGNRTLGENMADLSGTEAAFRAYERYQQRHGEAPMLEGFTGEQRFFLALAQMRRTQVREPTLRFLVLSDTHSPSRPRVNAAVRNLDAWYEAFPIRTTDPLYLSPDQRIHLW